MVFFFQLKLETIGAYIPTSTSAILPTSFRVATPTILSALLNILINSRDFQSDLFSSDVRSQITASSTPSMFIHPSVNAPQSILHAEKSGVESGVEPAAVFIGENSTFCSSVDCPASNINIRNSFLGR